LAHALLYVQTSCVKCSREAGGCCLPKCGEFVVTGKKRRLGVLVGALCGFYILFLAGLQFSYANSCELNSDLSRHDDDGDGILNKNDADLDGDGILNLIDIDPCDSKIFGEDQDQDGILDHIDFEVGGQLKPNVSQNMVEHQKKFWEKGIYINNQVMSWNEEEMQWINDEILPTVQDFKVQPFVLFKDRKRGTETGRYVHNERTMYITSNEVMKVPRCFQSTFTHEFFHIFARDHADIYQEFTRDMGWRFSIQENVRMVQYKNGTAYPEKVIKAYRREIEKEIKGPDFPSGYSKLGPSEMFSEVAAASFLLSRGSPTDAIVCTKFTLGSFQGSSAHNWFLDRIGNF